MRRDLDELAARPYDLIVVGGGIHGVCAAWEAARRGWTTCLLERGDFGEATSANSLRILHGGLRYLQHLDLVRIRESARESRELARLAPTRSRSLPFVLPTYGRGLRGRLVMAVAVRLHAWLTRDIAPGGTRPPRGRVVSREECLRQIPGIDPSGLTGAAVWNEWFAHDAERLLLAIVEAAVSAGATAANYAEVTGLLGGRTAVEGVRVRDALGGRTVDVRARLVLNAAGPWANALLAAGPAPLAPVATFAKAINLVTPQLFPDRAVAIPYHARFHDDDAVWNKGVRHFFIVPWGEHSLVGTRHLPWSGEPRTFAIEAADIDRFVAEINEAYPAAPLARDQVLSVHGGMVPIAPGRSGPEVQQLKHPVIADHRERDGVDGLLSLVGVKWTTARRAAEQAVEAAARRLDGARRERPGAAGKESNRATSDDAAGTQDPSLAEPIVPGSPVLRVDVARAVRDEMAQRLTDVLLRRTTLGRAAHPGEAVMRACAAQMAGLLGWDRERIEAELAAAREEFQRRHARVAAPGGERWRQPRS